jgi:hypothetical protein
VLTLRHVADPRRTTRSVRLPTSSLPGEANAPPRVDHLAQRPQGRRLAGAVGAEEDDHLAVVDREVDVAQHLNLAVAGAEARDLEEGHQAGVPR